jgi:hypothetical protein
MYKTLEIGETLHRAAILHAAAHEAQMLWLITLVASLLLITFWTLVRRFLRERHSRRVLDSLSRRDATRLCHQQAWPFLVRLENRAAMPLQSPQRAVPLRERQNHAERAPVRSDAA